MRVNPEHHILTKRSFITHYINGEEFRRAREGIERSLRSVAKELEISPTYLSVLERCQNTIISADLAGRVQAFLEKTGLLDRLLKHNPCKHSFQENVHMRICLHCRQTDYNVNYGIKGARAKWVTENKGKQ